MGITAVAAAASSIESLYPSHHLDHSSSDPSLCSNFHFSRRFPGESLQEALARHEHYLFAHMSLRRGMRILELGCGRGARARQLAHFSEATIIGIDADATNVEMARAYTADSSLGYRVQFFHVSMEDLPTMFDANSFDAIFCVESTTTCSTFSAVCEQASRLLKPGGNFAFYRWCMTDVYQPSLLTHRQVHAQLTAAVSGTGLSLSISSMRETQAVLSNDPRFSLLHSEDVAGHEDHIPWYTVLEEEPLALAWAWWRETDSVDPDYARSSILKAGKLKLFTPMALFVVRKKLS